MVTSVLREKHLFIIGGFIFSFLLFTSCVTTEEQARYFNDQIVAVNTRVDKLEQTEESMAVKLSGQIDSKLATIRDSQAEVAMTWILSGERYATSLVVWRKTLTW